MDMQLSCVTQSCRAEWTLMLIVRWLALQLTVWWKDDSAVAVNWDLHLTQPLDYTAPNAPPGTLPAPCRALSESGPKYDLAEDQAGTLGQ